MKKQQGFSLIEVMVTMVIVSIGLLGLAAIIVTSLKSNQSAYSRTQATTLANDIIDSMRANRATAENTAVGSYNLALASTPSSGADTAHQDLRAWRRELAANLPSGTGSVNVDAVTKNVTIVVQWDDSHASDGKGKGNGDGTSGNRGTFGLTAQQVTIVTHL